MSMVIVDKRVIETSNEEKIIFPRDKITKADLIEYYTTIAPIMLRHIKRHPITMQRFPDGINQNGFYQKDIGTYFPSWIKRVTIKSKIDAHPVTYVVCDNAATLAYLANQAVVTIHIWLSTVGRLHHPDRLIFDLDPAHNISWHTLIDGAYQLHMLLAHFEIQSFVMTTGSKGLHVVVPLAQKNSFTQTRSFTLAIALELIKKFPTLFTTEITKEKRKNKIFIDTLRNQWAQLAVAPYSLRPLPNAPIATPLSWSQLSNTKSAQQYTMKTLHKHIAKQGDPWASFFDYAQTLPKPKK